MLENFLASYYIENLSNLSTLYLLLLLLLLLLPVADPGEVSGLPPPLIFRPN